MTRAGETAVSGSVAAPRARCYIASPLGFTEAGRDYYSRVYLPRLKAVVEPVDPWALTTKDEIEAARNAGRAREKWLEVGRRNLDAIRSSEMLVAFLEGQEPDCGTVVEVGFAAALGHPCFGLRSDLREAGEPGMALNLQVETVIAESGGAVCRTLEELVEELDRRAGQLRRASSG